LFCPSLRGQLYSHVFLFFRPPLTFWCSHFFPVDKCELPSPEIPCCFWTDSTFPILAGNSPFYFFSSLGPTCFMLVFCNIFLYCFSVEPCVVAPFLFFFSFLFFYEFFFFLISLRCLFTRVCFTFFGQGAILNPSVLYWREWCTSPQVARRLRAPFSGFRSHPHQTGHFSPVPRIVLLLRTDTNLMCVLPFSLRTITASVPLVAHSMG